jgi:hypothetical protein
MLVDFQALFCAASMSFIHWSLPVDAPRVFSEMQLVLTISIWKQDVALIVSMNGPLGLQTTNDAGFISALLQHRGI